MKFIKSKNEWASSEEAYKTAKVFITLEWVHNNLIRFKNQEDKTENDLNIEALKAPSLLELNDNEKFIDIDGNLLDIEIRGTKNINDIFFKVKDVSEKFKLGDIAETLTGKTSSFKYKLHYLIFKIHKVNNKKGNNKSLFLTFRGLQKLIEVTHHKHITDETKYIIHKWLHDLFDKEELEKYSISLLDKDLINYGYVYCITSNICDGIKIGYWKGSINNLIKRYKTYYGNNLDIFYIKTMNPREIEQECFNNFKKYKLSNELYKKKYIEKYKTFLNDNKIECLHDFENDEYYKKTLYNIEYEYTNIDYDIEDNNTELNQRIKELENKLIIQSIKHNYERKLLEKQNENLKTNFELLLVKKELEFYKK
jgi:hypothetical protein